MSSFWSLRTWQIVVAVAVGDDVVGRFNVRSAKLPRTVSYVQVDVYPLVRTGQRRHTAHLFPSPSVFSDLVFEYSVVVKLGDSR